MNFGFDCLWPNDCLYIVADLAGSGRHMLVRNFPIVQVAAVDCHDTSGMVVLCHS